MKTPEELITEILGLIKSEITNKETVYTCIKCGSVMYDPRSVMCGSNSGSTSLNCNCGHRSSTLDDETKRNKIVGQQSILTECIKRL